MRPVAAETNLESLKAYTLLVERRALQLAAEVARLKSLSTEDAQAHLTEEMRDQYTRLQKKFFARAGKRCARIAPLGTRMRS